MTGVFEPFFRKIILKKFWNTQFQKKGIYIFLSYLDKLSLSARSTVKKYS